MWALRHGWKGTGRWGCDSGWRAAAAAHLRRGAAAGEALGGGGAAQRPAAPLPRDVARRRADGEGRREWLSRERPNPTSPTEIRNFFLI